MKKFTFDFSYWSHDKEGDHAADFADNKTVFNDLGKIVLDNAWGGYNVCLFAYGQTGAGKSYSMVGYDADLGIVPLAMEQMFERIQANTDDNIKYLVEVSMIEIYNEMVQDLIKPQNIKGGLKVRDHPLTGPYVEGLSKHLCGNYEEISELMEEGTRHRTVNATKMNKTSSRAHTIFQITLVAQTHDTLTGKSSNKTSKINLVDLAGSERLDKTGATGATMKEGVNINKSLSALGNVIKALAKGPSAGKKKKTHVPYRDSRLTWLLKQSLGGNSKTIMIAAISPAADNFDESMQTLRYANRAKMIKNVAKVNEDENAKVIRELKAEIEALREQVKNGPSATVIVSEDDKKIHAEYKDMKNKLAQTENMIKEMSETFEQKMKRMKSSVKLKRRNSVLWTEVCIVNLNEDEQMNEVLVRNISDGVVTKVCRHDCDPPPGDIDVVLGGLQIQKEHAHILRDGSEITLAPVGNARVFVNGSPILNPTKIKHNDRLLFGAHHYYRVVDPKQKTPQDKRYGYAFARKEFATSMFKIEDQEEEFKKRQSERDDEKAAMEEKIRVMKAERDEIVAQQQKDRKRLEDKVKEVEKKMQDELKKRETQMERQATEAARQRLKEEMRRQTNMFEDQKRKLQQEIDRRTKDSQAENKVLKMQLEEFQNMQIANDQRVEKDERNMRLLREQLIQMLPIVNEANGICNELGKKLFFSIRIVANKSADKYAHTDSTNVLVEIVELETGKKSLWNHEVLLERMNQMQEEYDDHLHELDKSESDDDPFKFDPTTPQLIGTSFVYLEPLLFLMPIHVFTPILSYKGEHKGKLRISVIPELTAEGEENVNQNTADEQLESAKGHPIKLTILIAKAIGLPKDLNKEVFCEYKFNDEGKATITDAVHGVTCNPILKHSREIVIDPVSDNLIRFIRNGALQVSIYGSRPMGREAKDKKEIEMEAQLAIDDLRDIKDMLATELNDPKLKEFPVTQQMQELIAKQKSMQAEIGELKGLLADDKRNDMLLKVVAEKKQLDKKFQNISHENELLKADKESQGNKLQSFKKQLEEADEAQLQHGKNKIELAEAQREKKALEEKLQKQADDVANRINNLRKTGNLKKVTELTEQCKNKDEEILRLRAELDVAKKAASGWCG